MASFTWEDSNDTAWERSPKQNAFQFTKAICLKVSAATLHPAIVSLGIDAFGTVLERVQEFISSSPPFTLVVCTPFFENDGACLSHGVIRGSKFCWVCYSSKDIEDGIRGVSYKNVGINELVEYWRLIQGSKDGASLNDLTSGRNSYSK